LKIVRFDVLTIDEALAMLRYTILRYLDLLDQVLLRMHFFGVTLINVVAFDGHGIGLFYLHAPPHLVFALLAFLIFLLAQPDQRSHTLGRPSVHSFSIRLAQAASLCTDHLPSPMLWRLLAN